MQRLPIVFPFSSNDIGGSHVATYELATALIAEFGRRCIFLCADGTPIADEARRRGIEVVDTGEIGWAHASLQQRRNPVRTLVRFPARLAIMRRIGPRCIVHANEIVAIQSFGLIAKLLGGRIVYHHHALNRMALPNRWLIGRADAIIAVSETCRAPLSFVRAGRMQVVLNPIEVPTSFDRSAARARVCTALQIDPDDTLIGFVGNLWDRKRPEFFLRTAAAMRSHDRKRFILFGRKGDVDIPEMQALAASLGIADRVTFAGFMMPAEDNIAALDLLMAPAVREPFGRTPIEAALLGTPWIATDDAGHGEIGRQWPGGRLVPIDADEATFAAAALAILADPASVLAAPEERAHIAHDFSPSREAREVNAIYERLER